MHRHGHGHGHGGIDMGTDLGTDMCTEVGTDMCTDRCTDTRHRDMLLLDDDQGIWSGGYWVLFCLLLGAAEPSQECRLVQRHRVRVRCSARWRWRRLAHDGTRQMHRGLIIVHECIPVEPHVQARARRTGVRGTSVAPDTQAPKACAQHDTCTAPHGTSQPTAQWTCAQAHKRMYWAWLRRK